MLFSFKKTDSAISSLIFLIVMCFLFSGCTTSHQVFKYESKINNHHQNLIPGVETEESVRKILIIAQGKGIEPENGTPMQKRFMAERAAVIDGYRQLTERLAGTLVNYYAESGKNIVSYDQVMIEANAYLRGAQPYAITYNDGYATANVKVYIEPRQSKFYHGSPISRGIVGTLTGATALGALGAGVGAASGAVETGAIVGASVGAIGGGAYMGDPENPLHK